MAGLAAGAKYSGAVVALAVAAACLAAPGMRPAARIRLLLVAGAACVAAFLVVCPWVVLDSAAFRSDLVDLFKAQDRTTEAGGWRRYLATAWGDGLGPVWCVAALVGIASAALGIVRGAAQMRPSRIVALTSIVALCAILLPRNQLAVGRYLLPVYPCCVALACAEVVSLDGRFARWSTWVLAAAASAWACAAVVEVPARWDAMGRTDPRDEMAQWMRRNVPDGAYVITDLYAPWLPRWDARRELEGRGVPPATQERLTPAYRISKAYIYFAGPLVPVADTGIAADDWRRLAKLGSVYVLATSTGRELFAKLVHSVDAPSRDEPSLYLYAVPPDEPR
jgi:hypothetical protein